MRLRKSDHDEPEPSKDADIERWFQALGELPVAHEPPGARLSMLARIEQRRKRWWAVSWLPTLNTPSLATGLAIGLLVSLAVNLSPVSELWSPNQHDVQRVVSPSAELPTYRFQRRIPSSDLLSETLANRIPDRAPAPVIGFMPPAKRPFLFRIGKLYADALEALHSGSVDTASQHLTWMAQALTRVQAPDALFQYIEMIRMQIRERPDRSEQWQYLLAGFEPFYHDAYSTTTPTTASLLFALGAWSEHLYLTATAGDVQGVRNGWAPQDVRQALEPLNLPPEYRETLDRLLALIDKPNLSTSDLAAIRNQVQTVQDLMGQ